jgi:hypothetical protein
MIESGRIHYDWGKKILRSHHLHPGNEISLFIILEWLKESAVSIIEDHLIENISSISWEVDTLDTDFWYLSERYNQFIQNISEEDKTWISCLIAISHLHSLSIATIGWAEAILVENEDISQISSHDAKKQGFHYISHWDIPDWWSVYLSNSSLTSLFWESLICDMTALDIWEWEDTVKSLIIEEKYTDLHIFRITHIRSKKTRIVSWEKKQSDIIMETSSYVINFIKRILELDKIKNFLDQIFSIHKNTIQFIIFTFGVIILFLLAYSLVNSLFNVVSTTSWDTKNELIKAQILIDQSEKLTSNKQAFNKNIKSAEDILFRLRDDKLHMADTQDLLSRIEVMKKEVNDIQTVDLKWLTSIIKFNPADISPIWVFEYNKKISMIWTAWAILGYSRGENLSKVIPYPATESAKSFSVSEDWVLFVLTTNDRVISPRRNEFSYITVTWWDGWEKAKSIKIFNNNIYLVSADGKSIFRHRPWVNGYSARTSMLENLTSKILDISIDGWVYIVEEAWKIQRFVSWKTEWGPKWLIINKVPGEYTIWQDAPLKIISQNNLVYVYVLSGNRIWIFSPDSKRFQDVNSLTYVAQLELQTEEEIRDIFIPRDWMIYTTTNMWVYEVQFEMVDGKLLLR